LAKENKKKILKNLTTKEFNEKRSKTRGTIHMESKKQDDYETINAII
jgi:hypothetical protein